MNRLEFQDGSATKMVESAAEAARLLAALGMVAGATYETEDATITEYWPSKEQAQMQQGVPAPAWCARPTGATTPRGWTAWGSGSWRRAVRRGCAGMMDTRAGGHRRWRKLPPSPSHPTRSGLTGWRRRLAHETGHAPQPRRPRRRERATRIGAASGASQRRYDDLRSSRPRGAYYGRTAAGGRRVPRRRGDNHNPGRAAGLCPAGDSAAGRGRDGGGGVGRRPRRPPALPARERYAGGHGAATSRPKISRPSLPDHR